MFNNARLITSAMKRSQWPEEGDWEFLFCGKSNVGKSSLINALCNRKNLAYVGKTPGKTRLLNFYQTAENIRLVDAPGYGFYEKKQNDINNFEQMIREYFSYRKKCRALLLLLNIQREVSEQDEMLLDLAAEYHMETIVVLTKADKLSNNQRANRVAQLAKQLEIDKKDFFITSSEKKEGIEDLCNTIIEMAQEEAK